MSFTPQNTLNDGGVKFVRQTIQLGTRAGATVTYIVKEGSMEGDVKRTTARNENDVENKQAFSNDIPKGSITLSFVNMTDDPPARLQSVLLYTTEQTQVKVILGKVGQKFGTGEDATCTCDIYEQQSEATTT